MRKNGLLATSAVGQRNRNGWQEGLPFLATSKGNASAPLLIGAMTLGLAACATTEQPEYAVERAQIIYSAELTCDDIREEAKARLGICLNDTMAPLTAAYDIKSVTIYCTDVHAHVADELPECLTFETAHRLRNGDVSNGAENGPPDNGPPDNGPPDNGKDNGKDKGKGGKGGSVGAVAGPGGAAAGATGGHGGSSAAGAGPGGAGAGATSGGHGGGSGGSGSGGGHGGHGGGSGGGASASAGPGGASAGAGGAGAGAGPGGPGGF